MHGKTAKKLVNLCYMDRFTLL